MRYKENGIEMELRRNLLLQTAYTLFTKRSIEDVNMTEIAKAAGIGMSTVYRYIGVKQKLVVELGTIMWQKFAKEIESLYSKANGESMTALEEVEFYLDSYIELYKRHPDLLCFNANFDLYIRHEHISADELQEYYDSVDYFSKRFSITHTKNMVDHTINTSISEQKLFMLGMYTMLSTAQKFAGGLIYPPDKMINCLSVLELQKKMIMEYITP